MPSQDTWTPIAATKVASGDGRIRNWVVTPNFGALDKDSKPVNPYSDRRLKTSQKTTHAEYQTGTGPVTVTFNGFSDTCADLITANATWATSNGWDPVKASTSNSSILKAFVKVADAKVNVAVAYAEAAKTSDLILDTARRIDKAYRAFRKGNLKGVAENLNITPKRLHKSWLEYKYGWMPLLMDVKGAAEFFAQQHVVRPPRFTVTAVEEVTKTVDNSANGQAYGGVPGDVRITRFSSYHCVAKTKLWCELTSPNLSALQQLGLTNPLLVAWELVPFSFVFDWFVQVGDYLTGLTALQGVTIRRQLHSVVDSRGWSAYMPATTRLLAGTTYRHTGYNVSSSDRRYTRVNDFSSPYGLYPPVTNSFNFPKLVTSLALIQGNYRGNARTVRV